MNIKSVVGAVALLALSTVGASAQYAPMDMQWMIDSQIRNQMQGDQMIQQYQQDMMGIQQEMRRQGIDPGLLPREYYQPRPQCTTAFDSYGRAYIYCP